ncbi:MAG: pyruvate ferredoxin oxidoreductase [Bacteroidales bacterium]|nr:pyruvate ferredoxin oxidoreductase [Bacteroidales bacterium]MCM1146856.1 pyruvate ferredoxin oxidoreductase [Bacteroidales bacterium]MCM1205646.1 pyruvate ferredoxin oxidoreductase [Bacillota bacterium]
MDYKYIEQLLERYWECRTTLEEEAILRAFFAQENVPVELLQYRGLFAAQSGEQKQVRISDDFDERILAVINDEKPVKARTITLSQRLSPLYRAAAVVAITLTLGTAAQKATEPTDSPYPSLTVKEPAISTGPSVAVKDSVKSDSIKFEGQHSRLQNVPEMIIK